MRRRDFVSALGAGVLLWRMPESLAAGGALAGPPAFRDGERLVERWSWAMGQPVHLQLYAESDDAGYEAAQAALVELRRVEARLSLFDDASDLCELNRRAGRGPMVVDADLAAVLRAAEHFRRETGGAFDVAVEPLMRAWGFHAPRDREPTDAELAEARAAVGAARVVVQGNRAALRGAQAQLDFGGIGVGYGLDRAIAVLRRQGIGRALLDVSGDCYALGAPPGEKGWLVGVADLRTPGRVADRVRLKDAALATSSNAVSVVRYGKAVRGHVMDPATGWPATRCLRATVVTRSGIAADALSKALLISGVAGPETIRSFQA